MVLVKAVPAATLAEPPSASMAALSFAELPPSDSFDHIDRLLDGPVSPPVTWRSPDQRWKTSARTPRAKERPGAAQRSHASMVRQSPAQRSEQMEEPQGEPAGVAAAERLAAGDLGRNSQFGYWWKWSLMGAAISCLSLGVVATLALRQPRHERNEITAAVPSTGGSADSNADRSPRETNDEATQVAATTEPTTPTEVASLLSDNGPTNAPSVSKTPEDRSARATPAPSTVAEATPRIAQPIPSVVAQETNPVEAPVESSTVAASAEPIASDPPVANTAPAETEAPNADDELGQLARWLRNPAATNRGTAPADADNKSTQDASPGPADVAPPTSGRDTAGTNPSPTLGTEMSSGPRPTPPVIDAARRLRATISGCRFTNTPLVDVVRTVSDYAGVPISLDPIALAQLNQRANLPISDVARETSIGPWFERILAKQGLRLAVGQGQARVVLAQGQGGQLTTVTYDLHDLTNGDPKQERALARWIQSLIAFGTWQGQGNEERTTDEALQLGKLRERDAELVVEHRAEVHHAITVFLERLRQSRQLPRTTSLSDDRVALQGTFTLCAALDHPVDWAWSGGATLHQLARTIEGQADVRVLIDWPALYAVGWTLDMKLPTFCRATPLRAALARCLESEGLAFRVVDADTIEISTAVALAQAYDVEVYRLGDDELTAGDVQALSQEIAKEVGIDAFQPQGKGAIAYDVPSRCLIVSLPQPAQIHVRSRIDAWVESRKGGSAARRQSAP